MPSSESSLIVLDTRMVLEDVRTFSTSIQENSINKFYKNKKASSRIENFKITQYTQS